MVYNLARYIGQLGYQRILFRNDAVTLTQLEDLKPSHIIISPGPCTPDKAGISLKTIEHFAGKIPILGVCLGHQAIGQVFGGKVIKALRPMHGMQSNIHHNSQGIFEGLSNPLKAGRYHSLVIDKNNFPAELKITAYSDEDEIMALEYPDKKIFGVQFHPESVLTEQGYELLNNFLISKLNY